MFTIYCKEDAFSHHIIDTSQTINDMVCDCDNGNISIPEEYHDALISLDVGS